MRLRICFEKGEKPVTGMVDYTANANLTSRLAVVVIVFQNTDRLRFARPRMIDTARMVVAV